MLGRVVGVGGRGFGVERDEQASVFSVNGVVQDRHTHAYIAAKK